MQTIILLIISEIISKFQKKTYSLPQGDEGKYITALPLTDRYASREFRVEPSLGTSQAFSIFEMVKLLIFYFGQNIKILNQSSTRNEIH